MKKALIVTHVSGFVPQFEMNNVRILQELGYEVHYASNFHNVGYGNDNSRLEGTGIVCHQVDFERSPFNLKENLRAYHQLAQVMEEQYFELMHCHTPVGAVYARLAARKYRKQGMKVIYTAHGFHFYKGAPLKFWMVSYPIERFLARYTDILIVINEEDLKNAKKLPSATCSSSQNKIQKKSRSRKGVYKIDSVGVDLNKYYPINSDTITDTNEEKKPQLFPYSKRKELGIPDDAFLLISVGELNWNKNHAVVVEALGKLKQPEIYYLVCGEGIEKEPLEKQAEALGIGKQVILPGFRSDVSELLREGNAMAFPSLREGLGLAAVEALASGIPVIASDNRGTREYMQDGVNGYVVEQNNADKMSEAIGKLFRVWKENKTAYQHMCHNCLKTAERFGSEAVSKEMRQIYLMQNF